MKNKNLILTLTILSLLVLVISCSGKKKDVVFSRVEYAPDSAYEERSYTDTAKTSHRWETSLVPVRTVLMSENEFPSIYGANGAIIFTRRLSNERSQFICNAFINDFEQVEKFINTDMIDLKSFMVTHWLLNSYIAHVDLNNCEVLLSNYDYARATVIASRVNMNGHSDVFLIAFPNRSDFDDSIILDISNFSNQDITRAFTLWKRYVSKGYPKWETGLVFTTAVQEFRSLIQSYGEAIMSKFKMFG